MVEQVGCCGEEEMLLEQEGVDVGVHLVLEEKIEFAVVKLHGQTLKTSFVIGKIAVWRYVWHARWGKTYGRKGEYGRFERAEIWGLKNIQGFSNCRGEGKLWRHTE